MNTEPQDEINTVLVAVTPDTNLSTDGTALDGVSGLRGSGIGATSDVYLGDCELLFNDINDNSIDVICTDPPYKYLDHKIETDFNESLFVKNSHRVLKNSGFIIVFGRGPSFYRINCMLNEMGFRFLEEIVWNKRRPTSAALPLARVHETATIYTKKTGKIKTVKVNYGELKGYDVDKIYEDLKRLGGLFNKGKSFQKVIDNLKKIQDGECYSNGFTKDRHKITFASPTINRCVSTYTIDSIENGCREQSIISDSSQHYGNLHPTQKPSRLMERILNLVANENNIVLDPFMGSGSTRIACKNLNIDFIGFEIDKEYFDLSNKLYHENNPLFNK